jgi:predicted kinase
MSILNIAIGVPGSGKSTYMKTLDAVYVSSDAIRKELFGDENSQENPSKVFGILNSRIKEALESGKNATYDATNVSRSSRKKIFKDYRNKADIIVAYYFETPIEEAKRRNNSRDRVVPEEVIDRMFSNLTPPTFEEGFDKIIYIKSIIKDNKYETIIKEICKTE